MLKRSGIAALAAMAMLTPSAHAGWRTPVDTPLDAQSTANARTPATAVLNGVPYVAWEEKGSIRVARLGATGWQHVGGALSTTGATALAPSLTVAGDTLYAAWEERGTGIAAARLTETGWQPLAPLGDAYAYSPALAVLDGVLHAAYQYGTSEGFDVRVARLGASQWESVGGPLDVSERDPDPLPPIMNAPSADAVAPSLEAAGGQLYAAWSEAGTVRVARLDGTSWPLVGGPVTSEGSPTEVDLTVAGGIPWVAWRAVDGAIRTHVARFAGTQWSQPTPPLAGEHPDLETIGGIPWLSWTENAAIDQVRVARLSAAGTAWQQPATGINRQNAQTPSLMGIDGIPFVAFAEGVTTAVLDVRVSRLEPEFTSTSATAGSTEATLVTRLVTFGLPYRVGFDVSGTRTATEVTSGDPATVATTVGGLSPRTTYTATPFSTAGAGPEVTGPEVTFTTTKRNGR